VSVCPSVCPSVHMEQLDSHRTDFHEIWNVRIFFEKPVKKIQVPLIPGHNIVRALYMRTDVCVYSASVTISRWIVTISRWIVTISRWIVTISRWIVTISRWIVIISRWIVIISRWIVTISRWIVLRMRNASDKSCTENQNAHFAFSNFCAFREIMWKNLVSRTGHRWQYGACALHDW
jgi:hypothetical protein